MDNTTAKGRLYGMTESLLKESAIPVTMQPVVKSMVKGYFDKINDSDIESLVMELATQVVPFILGITFESFLERLNNEKQ